MRLKPFIPRILMLAAVFLLTVVGQILPVKAADTDLTLSVESSTDTPVVWNTGREYSVKVTLDLSAYISPTLEITVPDNVSIAYPGQSELLGCKKVSEAALEDKSKVITYELEASGSMEFDMKYTLTHKLAFDSLQTISYQLSDAGTKTCAKKIICKVNNLSKPYFSNYAAISGSRSSENEDTYIPLRWQLRDQQGHYPYEKITAMIPLPQEGILVQKVNNSWQEIADGWTKTQTGYTCAYHKNYEVNGHVLAGAMVYELDQTQAFCQGENSFAGRSDLYLKYPASLKAGRYDAEYSLAGTAVRDGASVVIQECEEAGAQSGVYIKHEVMDYDVNNFFYPSMSGESKCAGDQYVFPEKGISVLKGTIVNQTGETMKNAVIRYTIHPQTYADHIQFKLGNSGLPASGTVEYTTSKGGDAIYRITADKDHQSLDLQEDEYVTGLTITLDQLEASNITKTLWTADLYNKESVRASVSHSCQILSAEGSSKIGVLSELKEKTADSWLVENQEVAVRVTNEKNSAYLTLNKGDSFSVNIQAGGTKMRIKNAVSSILMPTAYDMDGITFSNSLKDAAYQLEKKEIIIGAGQAQSSVPAGSYTLYTVRFHDDTVHYISTSEKMISFKFTIGPLVDTSETQENLQIPVLTQFDSGDSLTTVKTVKVMDTYDIDGDGDTNDSIQTLSSQNFYLTINKAEVVSAAGKLTSSYEEGEGSSRQYSGDSVGHYMTLLNNGQGGSKSLTDISMEVTIPKKGMQINSGENTYTASWDAVLTGVPELTGDCLENAVIEYKTGEAAYTTQVPDSREAFAAVTQVRVTADASGELTASASACVDLPFAVAFDEDTTAETLSYFTSAIDYQLGEQKRTIQNTAILVPVPKKISGYVFYDDNVNGSLDAGESAVSDGRTLELYKGESAEGEPLTSGRTNKAGMFALDLYVPGTYTLKYIKGEADLLRDGGGDFDRNGCYTFTWGTGESDKLTDIRLGLVQLRTMTLEQEEVILKDDSIRSLQIVPSVIPALQEGERCTYESSNPQAASVSDTGLITWQGAGEAVIRVCAPQIAGLAETYQIPKIVEKTVKVTCIETSCTLRAEPKLDLGTIDWENGTVSWKAYPAAETAVTVLPGEDYFDLLIGYDYNRNGICTKTDHTEKSDDAVKWSIEEATGIAEEDIYSEEWGDLEGDSGEKRNAWYLSIETPIYKDITIKIKAEEQWIHGEETAPDPVYFTATIQALSAECDMKSFTLLGKEGVIDEEKKTIGIAVPKDADRTALIPVFTVSEGAQVSIGNDVQSSGSSKVDFSKPLQYTVKAANGFDQKTYEIVLTECEAMPTAAVDYVNAKLTGLVSGAAYLIDGTSCQANEDGQIPVLKAWYGKTLAIVRVSEETNVADSAPQLLAVEKETIPPVIAGIEDGKSYCGQIAFTVTDEYLDIVTVDGENVPVTENGYSGTISAKEEQEEHIITAADKVGNTTVCRITLYKEHAFGEYIPDNNASMLQNGTKTAYCQHCGDARDVQEIAGTQIMIPKTEISLSHDGNVETRVNLDQTFPEIAINNLTAELAKSLLTEEEKQRVELGESLLVYLDIRQIGAEAAPEDMEKIENRLASDMPGGAVGMLLDISLFKKIGTDPAARVSDTRGQKIQIAVTLPESMKNTDAAKVRTYDAARVHNGVCQLLQAVYQADTSELIFGTDTFSTYAIVSRDTDIAQNPPGSGQNPSGSGQNPSGSGQNPSGSGQNPSGSAGNLLPTEKIAEELGVDADTAVQISNMADKYQVSLDTLKITEKKIKAQKSDGDMKGSDFGKLKAAAVKNKKNSISLKWKKAAGADGYMIYGSQCNSGAKKYQYKLLKTVSKKTTSYTAKKLKKGTYYKFIVVAFKKINGQKITLASSVTIHSVTAGGKYGVAKSIKINKIGKKKNTTKITLAKKKTAAVSAKEISEKNKIKQHRKLCYESSNKNVAAVSKSGKIKAVGKGNCEIYVYAQNGICKTIKVTVK